MDFRSNRDLFAKDGHFPGTVDDLSRERSARGEADKDNSRLFAPKVVSEMMADPPARAHPRSSHDHGAALYLVQRYRVGGFPNESQARQMEGIAPLMKQLRRVAAVTFWMTFEYLRR